jgi:lipopolysaccharide transport system ATP-binding protein
MPDVAVRVENLSKQYRIGERQIGYRTLRDSIGDMLKAPLRRMRGQRRPHETIWALKDISFEIRTGEVVGIVGRNGAGKSTLLKILSRITEPTEGYAEIHGRVGSLLEVGTGFHPELTGEENIFLNGAILGMTRAEIRRKFDEIVAFAEIERFIDTPVKHYSSGMYLRLAFAVAAHLEPEILLVDEVLAVGDAGFQKKCTGKMGEVARQGRTVLFVSHNMAAMRQLCTSAYLLNSGGLALSGDTDEVIRTYLQSSFAVSASDLSAAPRTGAGEIRFTSMRFEDEHGNEAPGLISGQSGRIVLSYSARRAFPRVRVCVAFLDSFNQRIMYLNSYFVREDLHELPPGTELVCDIPRVQLSPGRYRIELWIQSSTTQVQDKITDAGHVDVMEGNFFGTGKAVPEGTQLAMMDYSWHLQEARRAAATSNGTCVSH